MTRRHTATALALVVVLVVGGCSDDDSGWGDVADSPDETTAGPGTSPDGANTSTAGGSDTETDPANDPVMGRLSPLVEGDPVVDDNNGIFGLCGDDPQRVDLEPVVVTADELEADGYSTRGTPTDLATAEDFGTDDGTWIRVVKFEDGTWLRVATVTCPT